MTEGEHNQFYQSNAIIEDHNRLSVEDPDMDVIIGIEAGRRLPHVWLTQRQKRVSSLDICPPGQFTLLTGIGGAFWVDAAEAVKRRLHVPLKVLVIGPGQRYEDPYGDFARLCLPDETAAILVRPDLYVAWHPANRANAPVETLENAFLHILSKHHQTAANRSGLEKRTGP